MNDFFVLDIKSTNLKESYNYSQTFIDQNLINNRVEDINFLLDNMYTILFIIILVPIIVNIIIITCIINISNKTNKIYEEILKK